ncbi:hypothetical protein [Sphingopyxis sp. NJF-3]
MAEDIERLQAVRAIRDTLVEQMLRLDQLGDSRTAADLSSAIDRLNRELGEAPSEEEIERLRRNLFMN